METASMKIFLKVIKTVAFNVKQSDSVLDLKTLFREQEGILEHFQEIFFSGNRLNDDQNLIDCGVQDNSTLNLYVENSSVTKLFIAVVSKEKTIEIETKSQDTIGNIKSMVCSKEGIHAHRFSLFFNGKKLKDSKTVASVGVNGYSTLQLVSSPTYILSINLQLPNDDVVKTEAELLSTVADFKAYIKGITGILISNHRLLYEGRELEDSKTLAYYDLKEGSLLEIVPCKFQIFVKIWSGKTITLYVQENDTVDFVKEEVFRKLCLHPNEYHSLAFGGKRLEYDKDLASYGIKKQSTLYMILSRRAIFQSKLSEIADLDKSQLKSTTVLELKKLIETKWHRLVKEVILSELVLKDEDSLSLYAIHKDTVLCVRFE